jgi:hypothetical protein
MKRILQTLLVAALIAFGSQIHAASASTITLFPNPTDGVDSFDVGKTGLHHSSSGFDIVYQFTLNKAATLVDFVSDGKNLTSLSIKIFDSSNTEVVLTSLLNAGSLYTFHVLGNVLAGKTGFFAGTATFAEAPIPPALLLFGTALGGLGFAGWRRKQAGAAA